MKTPKIITRLSTTVGALLLPVVTHAQLIMPDNPGLSTATSAEEVVTMAVLFVTAIIGVLAILVIVIAGIMYMTSTGDENRAAAAKRALTYGIVGLVVALVAWVIVNAIGEALGAGGGGLFGAIFDAIF